MLICIDIGSVQYLRHKKYIKVSNYLDRAVFFSHWLEICRRDIFYTLCYPRDMQLKLCK